MIRAIQVKISKQGFQSLKAERIFYYFFQFPYIQIRANSKPNFPSNHFHYTYTVRTRGCLISLQVLFMFFTWTKFASNDSSISSGRKDQSTFEGQILFLIATKNWTMWQRESRHSSPGYYHHFKYSIAM
jgi:hypothetical protein